MIIRRYTEAVYRHYTHPAEGVAARTYMRVMEKLSTLGTKRGGIHWEIIHGKGEKIPGKEKINGSTWQDLGSEFKKRNGAVGYIKILLKFHTQSLRWRRKKTFKCQTCGKQFSTTGRLRTHLRIHTGDKPIKCQNAIMRKGYTKVDGYIVYSRMGIK